MTTYTEIEMLNIYRNRLGLSRVLMLPADEERQPLDRELLSVLRSRYLQLLASEDVNLLPVSDIGAECHIEHRPSGALEITMPDRCMRPVSLMLDCWSEPVYSFHRAGSALHRRQRIPLLRATTSNPQVFRSGDRLMAYGLEEFGKVPEVILMAVTPPADGTFRLAASLLPALIDECCPKQVL